MPREYIITMTALNRVGILSAVTRAMAELGGDLREASQTVVRGFFTMIFSAEFPETIEQRVISDHLQDTCRPFGIDVNIKEPAAVSGGGDARDQGESKLYLLRIGGENRPGILRQLSSLISMRGIDVVGMHAVRTKDGAGFEMVMKIAVPRNQSPDQLLSELNDAGRSFHITADVSHYS